MRIFLGHKTALELWRLQAEIDEAVKLHPDKPQAATLHPDKPQAATPHPDKPQATTPQTATPQTAKYNQSSPTERDNSEHPAQRTLHTFTRSDRPIKLPSVAPTKDLLRETLLALSGLQTPLHVIVAEPHARIQHSKFHNHLNSKPIPAGGLLVLNKTLAMASPELCFFHMAASLPLEKLIQLGYELCGSYSLSSAGTSGFVYRKPLTTAAKLENFCNKMHGQKGFRKATRAISYILDRSASPMETILSMLITLPHMLGGYHLPKPQLNARINPGSTAKRSSSKNHYFCDFFWPELDVAVEYDSDT